MGFNNTYIIYIILINVYEYSFVVSVLSLYEFSQNVALLNIRFDIANKINKSKFYVIWIIWIYKYKSAYKIDFANIYKPWGLYNISL